MLSQVQFNNRRFQASLVYLISVLALSITAACNRPSTNSPAPAVEQPPPKNGSNNDGLGGQPGNGGQQGTGGQPGTPGAPAPGLGGDQKGSEIAAISCGSKDACPDGLVHLIVKPGGKKSGRSRSCTGALVRPDLVATAKDCISDIPDFREKPLEETCTAQLFDNSLNTSETVPCIKINYRNIPESVKETSDLVYIEIKLSNKPYRLVKRFYDFSGMTPQNEFQPEWTNNVVIYGVGRADPESSFADPRRTFGSFKCLASANQSTMDQKTSEKLRINNCNLPRGFLGGVIFNQTGAMIGTVTTLMSRNNAVEVVEGVRLSAPQYRESSQQPNQEVVP